MFKCIPIRMLRFNLNLRYFCSVIRLRAFDAQIVAIFIEFKHDRSSSAKDLINKILEVESSFQVIAYTLSLLQ